MRVLIVCTAILAYANAAPSHFVPLGPLAVRTFGYSAAIPTVSSGDIHAAVIDAQVKYADQAQAAVDNARQFSEQAVEDLNVKAYSNVAAEQEKVTDAFWAAQDKKWQALDAIRTAEAQLDGALASNSGAAVGSYVAGVAPYSTVASYSAVPAASSGDIQAAAIDAQVKYADQAQAAIDKARQLSETAQSQFDSAVASNAAAFAKGAAVGSYVTGVAPYSAVASYSAVPTVSSGDIQAAAIDAQVKYADQTQAAIDKARQLSETAQSQFDSAAASNAAAFAKSAAVGSYVAGVAPYSAVASYSAVPTVSAGDIQAAAIDAQVKYADQTQVAIDKARQLSETAQSQFDSAVASNAAAFAKGAAVGSYVAGVAPYSAVASYSAVPTVSSGDIQAAAIDAQVKYADQTQAAIDKARQLSETAQSQFNSAVASNTAAFAKGAAVGSYVAGVAPYSAVASYSAVPTVSAGDIQAAAIDAQVKYADQTQAAIDKARQLSETAQSQFDSAVASNAAAFAKGATVGSYVAGVAPYSTVSSGDIQAAAIDTQVKYADLAQAAIDQARQISDNAQAQLDGAIGSNAVLAKGAVVAPYVAAAAPYSAVAPISPVIYPGFVAPALKSFSTQFQSETSKLEGQSAAEASAKSMDSEKAELEKSLKTAEANLLAAKSQAGKAFSALHTSSFLGGSVGLTNAYLTPSLYSSVAYGQPILETVQPIAPVVGHTYVKKC